jgi:hypothetical protein
MIGRLMMVMLVMMCIILVVGGIVNSLLIPLGNAVWLSRARTRCAGVSLKDDEVLVILPMLGSTAFNEVFDRVKCLFGSAACPFRVRVVVVTQGEDAAAMATLVDSLAASPFFRGLQDFSVQAHVQVLYNGPTISGPLAAFAAGAQLLAGSTTVVCTAPWTELVPDWDATVIESLRGGGGLGSGSMVLSHACVSNTMQHPTFPCVAFHGDVLMVEWMQFSTQPTPSLATLKALSSDFLAFSADFVSSDAGSRFLKMMSALPCPPSTVGVALAGTLWDSGVRVSAPSRLVVQGAKKSASREAYRDTMRSLKHGRPVNAATTTRVNAMLDALAGSSFEKEVLGTDMRRKRAFAPAIMGTLPVDPEGRDIEARYGSRQCFLRTLTRIRANSPSLVISATS